METAKKRIASVYGIIIIVCAIGMVILHLIQKQELDSYILPFVLLMTGIVILTRKPDEESKKLDISKPAGRFIIATLSISLISGIIVMLFALL